MNPEDDLVTSPEHWLGIIGLLLGLLFVWMMAIALKQFVVWAWNHRTSGVAARRAAIEAHPRYPELRRARGHLKFAQHMVRATKDKHHPRIGCDHCFNIRVRDKAKTKLAELEEAVSA